MIGKGEAAAGAQARALRRADSETQALLEGCTIALVSQLPAARVLAASFQQHYPGCGFSILILDALPGSSIEAAGLDVMTLQSAGVPEAKARQMPMLADPDEIAAFAKPYLLETLARSSTAPVIYFDPSLQLFAPLAGLEDLLEEHRVVTTPTVEWVVETSGAKTSAVTLPPAMLATAGNSADLFSRGESGGIGAPSGGGGMPASQMTASRPFIADDSTWDVGFWNLEARRLTWAGDHYEVDGRPLCFFRFAGYDADKPYLLSIFQGTHPRILLSENPALAKICEEYRHKLLAAGHEKATRNRGFDVLPSGLKIDAHMRFLYRQALERFHRGTGAEPPSPFGRGGEAAFVAWLNEPMGVAKKPIVTRYMLAIHVARDDVRQAYPAPTAGDAAAFWHWYVMFGRGELEIPDVLMPPDRRQAVVETAPVPYVNVAGFFRAELGIGEAARLLVSALQQTSVPFNTISYGGTANRQDHAFEERQLGSTSDINIVCINADLMPTFAEKMGPDFSAGRYTIGVWFWEVDEFPEMFRVAFNYVDEIWVASEFARRGLLRISPKPVFKFHLPIEQPRINAKLQRSALGLPDGFVFLFSFDFLSVLERKNPLGLIAAYKRAFKPDEGTRLVLKTINGEQRIREMEKLKFAARDRPDIHLVDGYLSSVEKNSLTAQCDCYVSLHRSEGFGLTMAEAMALGKPVIATGFSGNLEFMTHENSYLCDYEEREVGAECEPYPATAHWAEPNIEHAASLMRQVYSDRAEAAARGGRAARDIALCHSPAVAGRSIEERIKLIRDRRARADSARSFDILEDRIAALEESYAGIAQQRLRRPASSTNEQLDATDFR